GGAFAVRARGAGGAPTGATTRTFSVAAAPLTAGALPPPAAGEGAPFTNVVLFHFSDATPAGTASDFTAVISWGDGTTSPGTVVASPGGGFDVLGSHTYAEALTGATFAVSVLDAGGAAHRPTTRHLHPAHPPP